MYWGEDRCSRGDLTSRRNGLSDRPWMAGLDGATGMYPATIQTLETATT